MMTALVSLQNKIGVPADGEFGPKTLKAAASYFKLSKERAAHFFGQCAHETGGFRVFEENLNYSEAGLLKIFPKYFNKDTAKKYAKNPKMIANRVYANRMGNGDESSGEGWTYRGRGALQLTGKENYTDFSTQARLNPDLVETELAFESALFFFEKNNLWTICDRGVNDDTILALTKRINGGVNGLAERKELTHSFYAMEK